MYVEMVEGVLEWESWSESVWEWWCVIVVVIRSQLCDG